MRALFLDFTKNYNKLKTKLNIVKTNPAPGAAPKPATADKTTPSQTPAATTTGKSVYKDQLDALAKFSHRIRLGKCSPLSKC